MTSKQSLHQWQDVIVNLVKENSTEVTYLGVTYNKIKPSEYSINVTLPKSWDIHLPDISPLEDHIIYSYKDIENYFKQLFRGALSKKGSHKIDRPSDKETSDKVFVVQKSENIYMNPDIYVCDICNETIVSDIFYHHQLPSNCFDLCEKCYENSELEKLTAEEDDVYCSYPECEYESDVLYKRPIFYETEQLYICEDCYDLRKKTKKINLLSTGVGSFLDWLPIMRHKENNHFLLYNCNPDSPHYHKPGIATSDYNDNMSYHVIEDKTLYEFMNELQKLQEDASRYTETQNEEDYSWKTFYSSAIPYAASNREWDYT